MADEVSQNPSNQAENTTQQAPSKQFRGSQRGVATQYNSGKYQQTARQYPIDLFSNNNVYGGNYAVFYINVMEDSKLLKDKTLSWETVTKDNTELGSNIQQKSVSATSIGIAGAAIGSGVGSLVGDWAKNGGAPDSKDARGAIVGGAVGAAPAAVVGAKTNGKMSRQTKRLKETIALYVPNRLQARYSMNYQDSDLAFLQGAAQAVENAGNMAKAVATFDASGAKGAAKGLGNAAVAAALSAPGTYGDLLSAASGLAMNPKKEQIFKGVDFRTFSFEYQFAPRNERESKEVQEIIKMFKLHMHPEYDDKDNYLFIYPSEFDIYYYQAGKENMNLFRHTSCVLTEMTVDYTPNSSFSTFTDGSPTQINMTLIFKELAILTKDQILDGF